MHYFVFGFISGVVIGGFGFYEFGKVVGARIVKVADAAKQAAGDLKKGF